MVNGNTKSKGKDNGKDKGSSSTKTLGKSGNKDGKKSSSSTKTSGKFGDFEEVVDEESEANQNQEIQAPARVRKPRKGQFIGRILQRLGGNRMDVKATDGKIRNCRVPGRYRRRLWLRPGDLIIIVPWVDNDDKADVIYKYRPNEVHQLKKSGIMEQLKEDF